MEREINLDSDCPVLLTSCLTMVKLLNWLPQELKMLRLPP